MRFYKLTTFLASCVVAICGVLPVFAADAETTFPFVIEKGAPDNISNVQTWDGAKDAAAGADGFIKARQGEFFEGGEKVRLLGTNLCFGASCRDAGAIRNWRRSSSSYGFPRHLG